ncbi:MAG TPA: hypothetical protein VL481_00310 [Verrucomicrobiae bacterium]|nr:hypothetical protein [Verrucomicrobiae bacterium]
MKKHISTRGGSASIVIIAVLFLALMASLGVVFYQNFIQKKPETSQTQQQSKKSTEQTLKTSRIAFHSTIYALDYPETWKYTPYEAAGNSGLHIKSPDEKVDVRISISSGGIGGTCDLKSNLKISSYAIQPSANTNLTGQPTALVETMYDHENGGYDYHIGLTEDGGATHAAVGDAFCTVAFVGVASALQINDDGTVKQPLIIAQISFPNLQNNDKGPASPDMQTIKDLMKSDDYKAAVKILESARKE